MVDNNVCLCGDFNMIRCIEERRSVGNVFHQMASSRGLSDHCPLQLSIDEENWGQRPLHMLKCWETFPGYDTFV